MIRSGDDDRIINLHPSGMVKVAFHHYGLRIIHVLNMDEGFLFGGLSPPNRKLIPLRPPRLCGESGPILTPLPFFDKVVFQKHPGWVSRRSFTFSLCFTIFRHPPDSTEQLGTSMILAGEPFLILTG
jgi:hypothetical protein